MNAAIINKYSSAFTEKLFTYLGIAIAITLVWWPLLNSICCILFFASWFFIADKSFFTNKRTGYTILFSSLYIISLIGFFYSSNKEEALFRIQQKIPLLLFPFVFASSNLLSKKGVYKIMYAFSFSFAAFCIYCIGKVLLSFFENGDFTNFTGYNLIALNDMYPFITGVFCTFCIVFHFLKIKLEHNNLFIHVFFIFLFWIMLLLLANIIALFTAAVVTFFYTFLLLKTHVQRIIFCLLCGAVLVTNFYFNATFKQKIIALTDFSTENEIQLDTDASLGRSWDGKALRVAIWKCSGDLIRNNYIFGLGTGDVQDSLQYAYELRKFYFASRYNRYNAHNQYIQQMLLHGIFGLVLLVCCITIPFFYTPVSNNQFLIPFLFIFGVICFTESVLEVNKGIIWYSFFNSIFVFSETRTES